MTTKARKQKKPSAKLAISKETVKDLSPKHSAAVKAGMAGGARCSYGGGLCNESCY
jgi:hypothetical protein